MSETKYHSEEAIRANRSASNWIVRLSTGVIVVRAWTRAAAIKRAIQEEFIRVGGLVLFDRMGTVGEMHVGFESCDPRTWWDAEQGYEVDFDDTLETAIGNANAEIAREQLARKKEGRKS